MTFLTTDNKNGVFTNVDNDGICGRFVHTNCFMPFGSKMAVIIHNNRKIVALLAFLDERNKRK